MVERAHLRPVLTAELLSIGTELTVGDTADTNAGELARALTRHGVRVARLSALPDDLAVIEAALAEGLDRADLVISTGGLGPTPDDLTREAIAGVLGQAPVVDAGLEEWLRELWRRRDLPFVEANLKQAWIVPSATPVPNPNGTAPGWWVDAPGGRLIVALPGPPREMRPMWSDWVEPRLIARGLGQELVVRTLRTFGIGESQLVDVLGDDVMRRPNPVVTTYARQEAVDVRIAASPAPDGAATAAQLADEAEAIVVERLGDRVWGRDGDTWSAALDATLAAPDWRLALIEAGTHGAVTSLLASSERLVASTSLDAPSAIAGQDTSLDGAGDQLEAAARRVLEEHGTQVGLALVARPHGADTAVSVAVVTPLGSHREGRIVFLGGVQGRLRLAVAAVAVVRETLRRQLASGPDPTGRAAVKPAAIGTEVSR